LIYRLQGNILTLYFDYIPTIIDNSHPNFKKIINLIKKEATESEIKQLLELDLELKEFVSSNKSYIKNNITIEHGELKINDMVLHNSLSKKILQMKKEGFTIDPMIAFLDKLYKNPSKRAVDSLYDFINAGNIPITEDGDILTYKKINNNWTDCYTGKIDNSIGSIVTMPRNMVDENMNNTCSYGLHVASYDYMEHFQGSRIIVCKVSPEDVVAIPNDYNNTKMRVAKYEVIKELINNKPYNKSVETLKVFNIKEWFDRNYPEVKTFNDIEVFFNKENTSIDIKQMFKNVNLLNNLTDINDIKILVREALGVKKEISIKDYLTNSPLEDITFNNMSNWIGMHSWKELKEELGHVKELKEFFNNNNNSTYMWRDILTTIISGLCRVEVVKEVDFKDYYDIELINYEDIKNWILDISWKELKEELEHIRELKEFFNNNNNSTYMWRDQLILLISNLFESEDSKVEQAKKFLKNKLFSIEEVEKAINHYTNLDILPDAIRILEGVETFIKDNKDNSVGIWQKKLSDIVSKELNLTSLYSSYIKEPNFSTPTEVANYVATTSFKEIKEDLSHSFVLADCYLFMKQINPNEGDWKTVLINMINSILFFSINTKDTDIFEEELDNLKNGEDTSLLYLLNRYIKEDNLGYRKLINFLPELNIEILLAQNKRDNTKLAESLQLLIDENIITREEIIRNLGF